MADHDFAKETALLLQDGAQKGRNTHTDDATKQRALYLEVAWFYGMFPKDEATGKT